MSAKAQIVIDAVHRQARAEGVAFDAIVPHQARMHAEQSTARDRGILSALAAVVWTAEPDG